MRCTVLMTSLVCLVLIGCGDDPAPGAPRAEGASPAPHSASSTPVATPGQPPRTGTGATTFPADVVDFRKRRDQCDHFRGEEPGDDARAAELEKALERTCRGTDAELAGLRHKYRGTPAVIAALRGYEDQVE